MIKKKELLARLDRAEMELKKAVSERVQLIENQRRQIEFYQKQADEGFTSEKLHCVSVQYFQKAVASNSRTPVGRATFNRNLGAAIAFGKAALEAGAELEDGDES